MQSAALFGFARPIDEVIQQLPVQCRSSKCDYPSFASLAVCGSCANITSLIEPVDALLDHPETTGGGSPLLGHVQIYSTFILPNGLAIPDPNTRSNVINEVPIRMTSFGTANTSETNVMKELDTMIWSISMLRVVNDTDANSTLEATECALHYCVNSYKSSVINGTLNEIVTPIADAKRVKESFQDNQGSIGDSLAFNEWTSGDYRTDLSLSYPESQNVAALNDSRVYSISDNAVFGISEFFQSQLKTDNYTFYATTGSRYQSEILNGYVSFNNGTFEYTPSVMQVLYSSSSIKETFDAVAYSMTNALRTGADSDQKLNSVPGVTYIDATCYRIEWGWISLHLGVVLAGCMFVTMTLLISGRREAPVWKGSSLATMIFGMHLGDHFNGSETVKELEVRAGNTWITVPQEEGTATELTNISQEALRSGQSTPDRDVGSDTGIEDGTHADLHPGRDTDEEDETQTGQYSGQAR